MRTITILLFICTYHFSAAQVALKIEKESSNTTYYYPSNSTFVITEANGKQVEFGTGRVIAFDGDYELRVKTPWHTVPDIVSSDGGKLSLSYEEPQFSYQNKEIKNEAAPYILQKILTPSKRNSNLYNVVIAFSNHLRFSYQDGVATASIDNEPLEITDKHLIRVQDKTLKLRFDSENGEVWYTFETNN